MAARQLIVPGAMPARDVNGRSLPSKFRFYEQDTSTPATIFTDATLTVAHAWPLISDSAGRWPQLWAEEGSYFDVAWSDLATDSLIAAYADIRPLDDGVLASTTLAEAAADAALQSAADAAATLVATEALVASLGDFSDDVTAAQAAAVTATAAQAAASASAAAAAASAASINSAEIISEARATALRLAVSL